MRIRRMVTEKKVQRTDSGWRESILQPRYAPFYSRSRPVPHGWKWRSARASSLLEGPASGARDYVLVAVCRPGRAKWQAILACGTEDGFSVVARYEDHGSHPGLHVHARCESGGRTVGSDSLDDLPRTPKIGAYHRRIRSWTEDDFWQSARTFFRIAVASAGLEAKGPLP